MPALYASQFDLDSYLKSWPLQVENQKSGLPFKRYAVDLPSGNLIETYIETCSSSSHKKSFREVVKVDPPSRTVRVVKLACRAIFFGKEF